MISEVAKKLDLRFSHIRTISLLKETYINNLIRI